MGYGMLIRFTWRNSGTGNRPSQPDVPHCVVEANLEQVIAAAQCVAMGAWKAPRGPGAPVVNTWARHHPDRLSEWLKAQKSELLEVPEGQWRCWTEIAYSLLATHQFKTISCERCDHRFDADAIRKEWFEHVWSGRDAIGGFRHLCPNGHHLFFVASWIA